MERFSKTSKKCSTCEFWTGPRKPSTFRDYAEADGAAKGEYCGDWNGRQKEARDSCSGWKAWGVFK